MKPLPRLYAIADASFGDPIQLADSLFKGGARLVQVRNKKATTIQMLHEVEQILSAAPPDAVIIVNDRVDVALVTEAAGVHLGQQDLPAKEARRLLGSNRVIGISTHNLEQALEADQLPVDYIAVGPVFSTLTKENPDPVLGVEKLAHICQAVRKPVVAIGGIKRNNVGSVLQTGVQSVAVIHDVLAAQCVHERVAEWIQTLNMTM